MTVLIDGYAVTLIMLFAVLWFALGVVVGRLEEAAELRRKGWHR